MNMRFLLFTVLMILSNTACLVMAVNLKVQNQLYKSILHDSTKEIRQAIKAGADVNYTKGDKSPLVLAVLLKRAKAVQSLLSNGAQVDKTTIEYAIRSGDIKTAYLLAKKCGATVNAVYSDRYCSEKTLLEHALKQRDFETVLALIKSGADYSDFVGEILVSVEFLVYFGTRKPNCYDRVPWESKVLDILKEIIKNGYNINDIWSCLFVSSLCICSVDLYYFAYENIFNLLIENGANPNYVFEKNNDKNFTCTPLISAIEMNSPEVVKFLLDAGAHVNKKAGQASTGLQTPLAYAIDCYKKTGINNAAIIELLIEHGANLE